MAVSRPTLNLSTIPFSLYFHHFQALMPLPIRRVSDFISPAVLGESMAVQAAADTYRAASLRVMKVGEEYK